MNEASTSQYVYGQRIDAAMDFVERNLAEQLDLHQMARAASFSPFHFHRIFTAVAGETPLAHVRRVRLERAAALLIDQPTSTISTIGLACGFGTPSSFTRAFRSAYQVTPSEWRQNNSMANEVDSTTHGRRFRTVPPSATVRRVGAVEWLLGCTDLEPAPVTIQQLTDTEVYYVRHTGPFEGMADVFSSLFDELDRRTGTGGHTAKDADDGVAVAPTLFAVYHDDPNLTADERLRVSACVAAGRTRSADTGLGTMTIGGGRHAVASFSLRPQDYGIAWTSMLGVWLPASGYEPADGPYFERFPSDQPGAETTDHDGHNSRAVEICIPVQPLRS